MSSPAQWEKLGKNWDAFAKKPSGTGPWKIDGVRAARARRAGSEQGLLGQARVPKLDKLVLMPLPEANARVAALRSGQVDWIEAPAPDAVASLKTGRLRDRHQRLPAQLDVASVARRRLAVERHPRAQGGEPRDRPRGHEGAAGRPDDPGARASSRRATSGSASPSFKLKYDPGRGQEAAGGGRLRRRTSR